MLLACREVKKSFNEVPVLKGGYFHIEEKEKAALVGINGAGKSTLLNIITGALSADDGEVIFPKDRSIGYLTQYQDVESGRSIREELSSARAEVFAMEEELRRLEEAMKEASGAALEELMERYSVLTHRFEAAGGYACRSEINGVIHGLGFTEEEAERPCSVLSGGEKTRVALGKLLLTGPDLILLDEPTNHLDIRSVAWLEGYLRDYPGAVLVVSHDRYFLDRVVTKVMELEFGVVSMFTGNYTAFAAKKAQQREIALRHYLNQQKEIRHEEEVIAKLKSFNREKSIKRAESREKMLEKVERLEKPQELHNSMSFSLEPSVTSGNDVLTVSRLGKAFGSRVLFRELELELRRGEHVALIGDNGTGKTTLLKILNGLLPPDSGSVRLGSLVTIGYYDQEQQRFGESNTLFEELRECYPDMTDTRIRTTLAAFLFTGDDVFKPIAALSGGERGRLSLAKLMLSPCNLLILDEPTNHLDMASREILENAVRHYTGTVLTVSHDRYFINRVASRVLELEGGGLVNYLGNYDSYLEKKAQLASAEKQPSSGGNPPQPVQSDSEKQRRARKEEQAETRRREREICRLEAEIEKAEDRQAALCSLMEQPEVATDAPRLLELSKEQGELQSRLDALYEQWEALND